MNLEVFVETLLGLTLRVNTRTGVIALDPCTIGFAVQADVQDLVIEASFGPLDVTLGRTGQAGASVSLDLGGIVSFVNGRPLLDLNGPNWFNIRKRIGDSFKRPNF